MRGVPTIALAALVALIATPAVASNITLNDGGPSFIRSNAYVGGTIDDSERQIDYDAGLSANGTADPSVPDPQCLGKPWKNREAKPVSSCGLGAELAMLLPPMMWLRGRRSPR